MADVRFEHVLNCTEETFWSKLFFDEEFNRAMFLKHLGFDRWDLLEKTDSDAAVIQRVMVSPPLGSMPAALKSILSGGISYEEKGRFDKATRVYTVEVTPSKMPDKVDISSRITTRPVDDGKRVARVFEGSVKARIFAIGGILEKKILGDLRDNYDKSVGFTNQWLADEGLAS